MGLGNVAPLHAELVAQPDVQPVGDHDKARGDLLAARERDALPLRACCDVHHLGVDHLDGGWNFATHGVDHRVVQDAVLVARAFLDEPAEARDPGFAVERGGAQHGIADAGLAQDRGLRAVELLGAEIGRIDRVRIDQHRMMAGAAQHGRRGRAREAAACDQNVGFAHALSCRICMRRKG